MDGRYCFQLLAREAFSDPSAVHDIPRRTAWLLGIALAFRMEDAAGSVERIGDCFTRAREAADDLFAQLAVESPDTCAPLLRETLLKSGGEFFGPLAEGGTLVRIGCVRQIAASMGMAKVAVAAEKLEAACDQVDAEQLNLQTILIGDTEITTPFAVEFHVALWNHALSRHR